MTKPTWLTGLAVTVLAATLTGVWLRQPAPPATPEPPVSNATAASAGAANAEPIQTRSAALPATHSETEAPTYKTPPSLGPEPFADSLHGTDIDGRLAANAAGELILDTATRDFFDYFLNTVGEVSPERALAEIERLARDHLPPAAADQALALLDDYLRYKQQAVALGDRPLDPARARDPAYQLGMFQQALGELKALRRSVFSPRAHDAFFGLEEAYGDYTLASLALQQRDDLTPAARDTLMEWHRQQLPPVIRRTEQRLHEDSERHDRHQQAIAAAASPADAGERLRALGLAEEQVGQIVGYLEERATFDDQYQAFSMEMARLEASGLAHQDLAAQRSTLLEQHFRTEQARTWARLRGLAAGDRPGTTAAPE
ncbi:MAG: lipase secretion chaperone [Marinobacter sp.]|uniref:lipase secretion chaperone n=1 Tax=Marinobacter sp. TaxID=50741 RepID=UPI00299E62DF|nr:lipase secretion chaperone [Marinobacter sp.]MDX1633586.1 lipase secretion chaperone [Marinobacter sp.]